MPVTEYPPKHSRRTSLLTGATLILLSLAFASTLKEMRGEHRGARAKRMAAELDVANWTRAILAFKHQSGRLPTGTEGLAVLSGNESDTPGWEGPCANHTTDPWSNQYIYRLVTTGAGAEFRVISKGPDGVEGTADDLTNAPG